MASILSVTITLIIVAVAIIIAANVKNATKNIEDEMNLFDDAKWVEKVLLSCKTYKQLNNADKLTEFLKEKYRNKVESYLNLTIWRDLSNIFISLMTKITHG